VHSYFCKQQCAQKLGQHTCERNPNARNYYALVEAVAPDGRVLSLPILSEEDGRSETVSKFGVRIEDCFHMTETGPKWFSEPQRSIEYPAD
jgi:hypothetical protein